MTEPDEPSNEAIDPAPVPLLRRAPRAALVTFIVMVAAALPYYLYRGRAQWFFQDEWDFLADRDGGSAHDLLRPHNEHWSTLPIVVYRVLWRTLGLRHYAVYQSLSILTHLAAATLLYVVIRRSGVAAWIATAAGIAFVYFGSGYQDIIWAFQIGYVGAAAFGLGQLVLADHDGPISRRDGLALLSGLAALLCAGVSITLVLAVGIATLLRRGWRAAAFNTVPLAAIYLAWFAAYGHEGYTASTATPASVADFAWTGMTNVFGRLEPVPTVGLLLALVLGAGAASAVQRARSRGELGDLRVRASMPLALLLAMVVFFAMSGAGRAVEHGADFATRSRYAHIGALLVLPAVAFAIDELVRRWRFLAVPALVLLLLGVPANLNSIRTLELEDAPPRLILAVASADELAEAPGDATPFGEGRGMRGVTVAWLRQERASGRIPPFAIPPPALRADAIAVIALQVEPVLAPPSWLHCRPLKGSVVRTMRPGDAIIFEGEITVQSQVSGRPVSRPRFISVPSAHKIVNTAAVMRVTLRPAEGSHAQIC